MVAYAFNAALHSPRYGGGGSLPVGEYVGIIANSSQEMTKDGQGGFIAFELKVIDGPLTGQTHTDRLNLHNKNAQTVEIANNQLSAYSHVVNKIAWQDTVELHNIPFKFKIGQSKDPKYTEVTSIYDINGNEPGKQSQAPQTYAPPVTAQPAYTPPAAAVQPTAQGGWGNPAATAAPAAAPAAAPGGWAQGQGAQAKPSWG